MEIRVTSNKSLSGFSGSGTPQFTLQEITQVVVDSAHRSTAVYTGNTSLTFGLNEWKKLVAAKGDLSVLGVTEIKDQPVQNFDASWQEGSGEKMPKG
jgi:predicted phage gp36 major capsid-like protein